MNMKDCNRAVIAQNVDRDPVGSRLTSQVRQEAINFAVENWPHNVGNGVAAQIGIKHVTSRVFEK